LNATFTRIDATHYRVVFRGRFRRVIPFRYSQMLEVMAEQGEAVTLSGSRRLIGFGTFQYDATAIESDFTATFHSRRDT